MLWLDPSIRIRYSLADFINDKLVEKGIKYTVQQIGNDKKLREDPAIVMALQYVSEIITGEFAAGEGKTVNLIAFNKDGDKIIFKGRVVSVIQAWTDKYPIKPSRRDLLLVKKQPSILDFFDEAEKITLYDYITNRKMKEKREYYPEYPVIEVKTKGKMLYFTPSDVLIQYREEKMTISPKERYELFEQITKDIVSKIRIDFPFLSGSLSFEYDKPREFEVCLSDKKNWSLEVIDNSGIMPLRMLRDGGKPLGGPLKIYLVYIIPKVDAYGIEKEVNRINELINSKFKEHNLGEIIDHDIVFYDWVEQNVEKTRENIKNALRNAINSHSNKNGKVIVFPIVVGPSYKGRYYEDVKREASILGKHSQIILWDNFIGMSEQMAATLACDIYVEALIQENIERLEELDGLVWRLARPADKKGETVYVGFDYSTDREGRVSGAFALLCDSYGRLISVKYATLTSDYISEEAARDILVYTLKKAIDYANKKKLNEPKRIVFYRDGPLRSIERRNILMGLERAIKALDIDSKALQLDLVEVIKRHSKRIYSNFRGVVSNPWFGKYVVIPVLDKFHSGRALVASTYIRYKDKREEQDFTVKPVEVRYASYGSSKSSLEKIVDEYLALTALNF